MTRTPDYLVSRLDLISIGERAQLSPAVQDCPEKTSTPTIWTAETWKAILISLTRAAHLLGNYFTDVSQLLKALRDNLSHVPRQARSLGQAIPLFSH